MVRTKVASKVDGVAMEGRVVVTTEIEADGMLNVGVVEDIDSQRVSLA
jgi:hypothetical protein